MPTLKVLWALVNAGAERAGSQIVQETGLSSGTLYPILIRLEEAGWLESRWEGTAPQELRRPRRRLYLATELGRGSYMAAMRELGVGSEQTA